MIIKRAKIGDRFQDSRGFWVINSIQGGFCDCQNLESKETESILLFEAELFLTFGVEALNLEPEKSEEFKKSWYK